MSASGRAADESSLSEALAGIVLCGGRSSRMGVDKAKLRTWNGSSLLEHVVKSLSTIATPIILAPGRASFSSNGKLLQAHPHLSVDDTVPGGGPLSGIVAALAASPHRLNAVVAVDMPLVSPSVLALLRDLWTGEDAVVPVADGRMQPLHAIYSSTALAGLRSALENDCRVLRHALLGIRVREVHEDAWRVASPDGRFASNVNRPEDLREVGLSPPLRRHPTGMTRG
ncbi:MAG TPA: molybdenum cofactor guanylyltransferase [Candidatus Sulfotelmatobacter sp.]|nr:molybdenum cofactor guanylyltransferase [Candidatus Sulfotelmatobacter sp.]